MKGKIILLFVMALVALTVIGLIGQYSLREMISSIEEASTPNQKVATLHTILQDLSDAENSVRTFTITRDGNHLNDIANKQREITQQLARLQAMTADTIQLARIDSLNSLIDAKFTTLQRLINVRKNDQDNQVLNKIREDIRQLKKQNPAEEEDERSKNNFIDRLFGKISEEEDTASGEKDSLISSAQLGKAIDRIGQENAQSDNLMKRRELSLTRTDNTIMDQIRLTMNHFEDQENLQTKSRAERTQEASRKTITTITATLIVTLVVFAVLLLVIFNDISRNQRNRVQLRKAKEKAERLARVKEEFLSNMSHEIRTPLNSILGFADQLTETRLDPLQQDHLTKIRHSGDHLLQLINDILDYAKMDSGKLELENRAFDPRKEIHEIIEIFRAQALEKGLLLTEALEDSVPEVLTGDPVRFRQVLINLISNALKFTQNGRVTIRATSTSVGDRQVELHLAVADTGIGIAAAQLKHIFEDFAQADSSTARKYGGTGLGLSIVNKIAHLHNGHVRVNSVLGEGTEFEITLQYQVGTREELEKQALPAPAETVNFPNTRALVIDDQVFNLELIDIIFRKWGVRVDLFAQGAEGLEAFHNNRYDIVFLDLHMPEINGIEIARAMRAIDPDIPIVALTAGTSQEDLMQSREAGMNDYLLKPYKRDHLYRILQKYLPSGSVQDGARTVNGSVDLKATAASANDSTRPDLSELVRLSGGDQGFVRNMLDIFQENFVADLEELREAIKNRNGAEIRGRAHKMVPPCRHLGFEDMATGLKKLENDAYDGTFHPDMEAEFLKIEIEFQRVQPLILEEIKLLDQKIELS